MRRLATRDPRAFHAQGPLAAGSRRYPSLFAQQGPPRTECRAHQECDHWGAYNLHIIKSVIPIMAGHSKWANIKHRKAATDAKRGKIFSRLIREIAVAAKLGTGDVSSNPRLRLAVDKATDNNMPKDTIERAIKRGSGGQEGVNYEEIRYEGYGINGAAVIVDCLSDNRTRTVADIRHAFSKHGGNLGTDGSVAFLFKQCGQIVFAPGTDENRLLEVALDAGAEDVIDHDDGSIEVLTAPHDFVAVKAALGTAGFKPEFAEVTMKPTTEVVLAGDEGARMQRLLDAFETLDNVQNVYTTAVIEEA
jgi:YebC/PmpR family DNA-binding regulatory protein